MSKRIKTGFTLAEIMIVLSIIGVLTAILMPIALHSAPDENVMKFKKADTTFKNVIRELVNSEQYYVDGDLGTRRLPDGTSQLLDGTHAGDKTYFCESFADVVTTKKVNCSSKRTNATHLDLRDQYEENPDLQEGKYSLDEACMHEAIYIGEEIVTNDKIVYYQSSPFHTFGVGWVNPGSTVTLENPRLFGINNNSLGFDQIYKVFCIDIDGIPTNITAIDCVNECPFGYGIRADGKIISGKRADEWLEKGFQKGKDDN